MDLLKRDSPRRTSELRSARALKALDGDDDSKDEGCKQEPVLSCVHVILD
jgi:hypothetical protein